MTIPNRYLPEISADVTGEPNAVCSIGTIIKPIKIPPIRNTEADPLLSTLRAIMMPAYMMAKPRNDTAKAARSILKPCYCVENRMVPIINSRVIPPCYGRAAELASVRKYQHRGATEHHYYCLLIRPKDAVEVSLLSPDVTAMPTYTASSIDIALLCTRFQFSESKE